MPSPYNATLVGGGDGICLEGGATFRGRDVLVTGFAGAALQARGMAASWLAAGGLEAHLEYEQADAWLLDVRDGANPDPRPRSGSPALRRAGKAAGDAACIGAFGGENWLEGRTPTFGPDPDYDTGEADAGEDRQ